MAGDVPVVAAVQFTVLEQVGVAAVAERFDFAAGVEWVGVDAGGECAAISVQADEDVHPAVMLGEVGLSSHVGGLVELLVGDLAAAMGVNEIHLPYPVTRHGSPRNASRLQVDGVDAYIGHPPTYLDGG